MNKIVNFGNKKEFRLMQELGRGACGLTVLLYDEIIKYQFVCKKYSPIRDEYKEKLFESFINEIKILHLIHHKNIVRVFNYYLYPDQLTGYIVMDHIVGKNIDEYISAHPENINEIFIQMIEGFSYLESNKILHRDIRADNILITEEHTVKIIDFGFGKHITETTENFNKTFSLNLWCERPKEFEDREYTFCTEVYFVGKLFKQLIEKYSIKVFNYSHEISVMCQFDSKIRIQSFYDILKRLQEVKFSEIEFSTEELKYYKQFSEALIKSVIEIENSSKFYDNIVDIKAKLEHLLKNVILEDYISNNYRLLDCFISGDFGCYRWDFPVQILGDFITLLNNSNKEKQEIILNNITFKLDSVAKYIE